jgi:predicted ester cyclase
LRSNDFYPEGKMKAIEQNKVTIWQMFKTIEQKGFTAQSEFFADKVLSQGIQIDRGAVRSIFQDILTTFPDVKMTPLNIVAEGDWVVARCMFSGTHKGTGQLPLAHEGLLVGVTPTGKSFRTQHIHMFRLKDNLIVEHWAVRNDVDMARSLGLLPEAAISAAR